jgi:hypothetical protein
MLARLAAALLVLGLSATTAAATGPTTRTYRYGPHNQIEAVTDSAHPERNVAFTNDANGNRLSKTQGGVTTAYG